jgi:microsomal epoxide hydrolase
VTKLASVAGAVSLAPVAETLAGATLTKLGRADSEPVAPFRIEVPQAVLDDLRERLARIRWPDDPTGGWSQGTSMEYLRALVDYWRTGFDWRKQERHLNELPHFQVEVDGSRLHFIHVRGRGPKPLPLVLSHGWPSSFAEFVKIIPLLTDPAATGGDPADAFDVVVPSLPGYGFSARPREPGMTTTRIAKLWANLMTEHLGYPRFCAHGGDIGAGVTNRLGLYHPEVLHGVHVMAVLPPWLGAGAAPLSAGEQRYQTVLDAWEKDEGAYSHLQRTRPQTLAFGMHDSPVGLAAWIVKKLRSWSDCAGNIETRFTKDELLTGTTLYWVTETFGSSVRLYYDSVHFSPTIGPDTKMHVPAAIALTTEEVNRVPRERAERTYANIQQWTEFRRGGHFMAHEEPLLLAEDLRMFFRRFR